MKTKILWKIKERQETIKQIKLESCEGEYMNKKIRERKENSNA